MSPTSMRVARSIPFKALDPTGVSRLSHSGTYFNVPTTDLQLINLCGGEGVLTHGQAQKMRGPRHPDIMQLQSIPEGRLLGLIVAAGLWALAQEPRL